MPYSLILVIDQGEELFTLNWKPEDRARRDLALEMLRQTLSIRGNFELVLALRTEYYGRLVDRLRRGVRDAVGVREYLLTDFDEERLTEAILRPTSTQEVPYSAEVPFAKYGFRYADGVGEDIARQVVAYTRNRQDSVLPLAQVICTQLYDLAYERGDKAIVLEDLKRIGGIQGGMRKHVEGLSRRLFTAQVDRAAFQRLMAGLYRKQPDGTLTTDLLPAEEAADRWAGKMPFEAMLDAASQGDWRLLRVSMLRGEQGERPYLSLGHDALAKVAEEWDEDSKRGARLRKLAATVVGTAVLALVMAGLAGFSLYLWQKAEVERHNADTQAIRAKDQERLANEEALLAQRNELKAISNLYVSQMSLVQRAWSGSQITRTTELLGGVIPRPHEQDLRSFEWFYYNRASHSYLRTFRTNVAGYDGISISPDDKIIAAANWNGILNLWESASGNLIHSFTHNTCYRADVQFSPDGRQVAATSHDNVRIWDVVTKKETMFLPGKANDGATCLAFHPNGTKLAVGYGYRLRTVRIWDLKKGKVLFQLPDHTQSLSSVAFSPDGSLIASATGSWDWQTRSPGQSGEVKLWDAATGKELKRLAGHKFAITRVAFSRKGNWLLTASTDGTIKTWNIKNGTPIWTFQGHEGWVCGACFTRDGNRIVSSGSDTTVRVWDAWAGEELYLLRGHETHVYSVTASSNGKWFASGDWGTVKVWDANARPEGPVWQAHQQGIQAMAFAANGRSFVSAAVGKQLKVWDVSQVPEISVPRERVALSYPDDLYGVASAPDGSRIACVSYSGRVRVIDTATGKESYSIQRSGSGQGVAYSSDGKVLAFGDGDVIRICDSLDGRECRRFNASAVGSLTITPDKLRIISMTSHWPPKDGEIHIWDIQTGSRLRTIKRAGGCLAVSVNARLVAGSPGSGLLTVWETDSGKEVWTLRGHKGMLTSAAFSPDGRRIVSVSSSQPEKRANEVKIWDLATGQEILSLSGSHFGNASVVFSPDGRCVLLGGGDGTLRMWRAATEREAIDNLERHLAEFSKEEKATKAELIAAHVELALAYFAFVKRLGSDNQEDRDNKVTYQNRLAQIVAELHSQKLLTQEQRAWIDKMKSTATSSIP